MRVRLERMLINERKHNPIECVYFFVMWKHMPDIPDPRIIYFTNFSRNYAFLSKYSMQELSYSILDFILLHLVIPSLLR